MKYLQKNFNFWISIQYSFRRVYRDTDTVLKQISFSDSTHIFIKSIKYYISTYGGKVHMHEYSKIHVDRHIDIEIILHHAKCMNILSVVW